LNTNLTDAGDSLLHKLFTFANLYKSLTAVEDADEIHTTIPPVSGFLTRENSYIRCPFLI